MDLPNFKAYMNEPTAFFDRDYAEWVWTELNTLAKVNKAHDKVVPAFDAVRDKLKKLNDAGKRAFILSQPNAATLKKAHDIEQLFRFFHDSVELDMRHGWQAFEPNCMEGQFVALHRRVSDMLMDGMWKRMNKITGQCDWPDWRFDDLKVKHAQQRATNAREVAKIVSSGKYLAITEREKKALDELKKLQEMKRSQ